MAIYKCKMCGGNLNLEEGLTVAECEYCGSKQTLPRFNDEKKINLYDRANHFRRNNDFDKAEGIYEQILNEDTTDAEAYWSLVLCRYGIEYVEDPATHKRLPTVNRAQYTSVFADENYKKALEYADTVQKEVYEAEAKAIDEIQKGILEISAKEEPFDVFICYKETDNAGRRTQDSVLATELYHELTKEGFKVFFSRITLEDKLGTAYEPYIFAALNSAKVMVVLGTRAEHFNAVWVKNEWSRYLALIRGGAKKTLIPAYRDMDPYDLPEEFSHLQAQDMSKLGFMQDLIRGIKKILETDKPKEAEPVVVQASAANTNLTAQLKRGQIALEDGDWEAADGYFDKALDLDAECAEAYFGKALAAAKCATGEAYVQRRLRILDRNISETLVACEQDTDRIETAARQYEIPGYLSMDVIRRFYSYDERTYESKTKRLREEIQTEAQEWEQHKLIGRALRYAKGDYAATLQGLLESTTNELKSRLAQSEEQDRQNAEAVCKRYEEEMDKAERNAIAAYEEAQQKRRADYGSYCKAQEQAKTEREFEEAAKSFALEGMRGYEDSNERARQCREKAEDLKAEAERKQVAQKKEHKKKTERIVAIIIVAVLVCVIVAVIVTQIIIPKQELNKALGLLESGDYEAAYALLEEIGNSDAIASSKYDRAVALIESGDNEAAYMLLNGLDYKDSASKRQMIEESDSWLRICPVGGIVTFGSYEQDNNTANGKENVEWLVLAKEGNRVLLISRYALDCQQYNTSSTSVTWETCSLRNWLNGTFLSTAFSEEERAIISFVSVSADKNPSYSTSPGNSTTDQVFLLSITEANQYFSSNEARICVPTAYSIAQGAWTSNSNKVEGKAAGWWWLRSPGNDSDYAAGVGSTGSADTSGNLVSVDNDAVRPALWINLE